MPVSTINEVFYRVVDRHADQVMLHQQGDRWNAISSAELYRSVVGVSRALAEWGISKGDRVAILSENRPEWPIAEFATLLLGAVVVPIYPTLTPEQSAFLLRDAGARILFVSTPEQLRKALSIQTDTAVERVVVMDSFAADGVIPMHRLMQSGPAGRDGDIDSGAHAIVPDDLASIIYTSGTTGTPKGAMLTHGNLASNLIHSLDEFNLTTADLSVSFLPLSHITARHVDYAMLYHGVTVAYCPNVNQLLDVLRQVRPTFFVAVPRIYEKIANGVDAKAAVGLKRRIYSWARAVGRRHRDDTLAGRVPNSISWKIANQLVFQKVRAALGGRVKCFISGGAPLGRDLAEWYAGIGIRIHEGYGLTETSPVIALNSPNAHRIGTVGRPLPNVEVRIADDGEILVRGPSIFKGYWNLPLETAGAFEGGWFKTGDIGELDADGYLRVTDRKKELLKTSGGKFIAPQPIEGKLKSSPLVAEAVVVGDKRKFAAVLLCPNFEALEPYAREKGIPFASHGELVANPLIQQLYEGIVAEANHRLAQFEKLKKVLLIAEEFSVGNGTLTPTMKLRRRVVEERYAERIQALYAEAELAPQK